MPKQTFMKTLRAMLGAPSRRQTTAAGYDGRLAIRYREAAMACMHRWNAGPTRSLRVAPHRPAAADFLGHGYMTLAQWNVGTAAGNAKRRIITAPTVLASVGVTTIGAPGAEPCGTVVNIYPVAVGASGSFTITDNGVEIFTAPVGRYRRGRADSGRHHVRARHHCLGGAERRGVRGAMGRSLQRLSSFGTEAFDLEANPTLT